MLAAGGSLAAFVLLTAGIAAAVTQPYPIRRASVTAVQNNDNKEVLDVKGGGFASGAAVQLGVDSQGQHAAATHPVTVRTDAVGNFNGKMRLPRALRPGRYSVTAHGAAPRGGTAIGSAPLAVHGRARAVGGSLPYTGAPVIAGVVLGVLALAGGTAAVVGGGRRSRG
jgi:hypothetical protein